MQFKFFCDKYCIALYYQYIPTSKVRIIKGGILKECGLAVRQATHGATRNDKNERIGKEDVHSS